MLKKLIAKLRKTIAPSSVAQPPQKPTASKPSGRDRNRSRPQQHDAKQRKDHRPRSPHDRQPSANASGQSHSRARSGSSGRPKPAPAERPVSQPPPPKRNRPVRELPAVPKVESAFSQLGLSDRIAFAVQEKGYTEPTPIQSQAIPLVIAGRDVIGSAQTGTGKTAAFALPILERLGARTGHPRCLVLEPTRELALQVEEAFRGYGKFTQLDVTVIYGGVGYGKQREDLENGVDIIVATPGRLLDHMEQGAVSLSGIDILVLDEVDRMLDMGFLPDVKRIVSKTPKSRQTLFFTATIPPEIASLAGWALRDPVEVKIGQRRSPAETVEHAFYPVVASQKFDLLLTLLEATQYKSVIIFCRTRMGADRIAHRLIAASHTVGVLHSDRSQRERVESLEGFKSGRFEMLVATDIAARGLDIAGVSHVINYDVPENPEDYVHRIGRTGRAQHSGEAFTLVTEDDVRNARSIERFIDAQIERKKFAGFPYVYSALFDESAQPSAKPASRLTRGARR
ncbi:MAG: DEAD/DEAH box helicase [Opitutaceae bacterium]|nr:DEAD/DEAH box helicase [Opitutaceae bacterium]